MKKQIFILFLALFAYSVSTFGQVDMDPSSVKPKLAANCTGDADSPLNPKPGIPYDYGVIIGNTGVISGNVDNYFWWATKNPVFVDGTVSPSVSPNTATGLLTVGNGLIDAGTGYALPTGGTQTMSITWDPVTLAGTDYRNLKGTGSPTFVAVMAQGACSNNIQVYEINPLPAFTVDITNIAAGSATAEIWGATISSCVSEVVSAVYNPTSYEIDMDYGKNTIYFEVISANFVGSWTPTITIDGLDIAETASVTIHETWDDAQSGNNVIETINFSADGSLEGAVPLIATTVTNTTAGVSVWLAVTVFHNTYETLGVSPITVTVGGMDSTGVFDLADNCNTAAGVDADDYATQDITPRPDIIDTTGDPATPVPGTFIIKTP